MVACIIKGDARARLMHTIFIIRLFRSVSSLQDHRCHISTLASVLLRWIDTITLLPLVEGRGDIISREENIIATMQMVRCS